MSVTINQFGITKAGQSIDKISLKSANGLECILINYGATIQSLFVKDRVGGLVDVVLGYDTLVQYEDLKNPYHGATIGRNANRIKEAKFILSGECFFLKPNERFNNLHSGPDGFNQLVWEYKIQQDGGEPSVVFHHFSPDGESGFPGNLNCYITFSLTLKNELVIEYTAQSDQETVINLTNHAYFNLAGQGNGSILSHELELSSDYYSMIDSQEIPTGELGETKGTPFDFTKPKCIGVDIDSDDCQIINGSGYDHNFIIRGKVGELRACAKVHESKSGITMRVETTSPGVQIYSGNFMTDDLGKKGSKYLKYYGLCLETQYTPDSMNNPDALCPIFKSGEHFHHITVFRFSNNGVDEI